MTTVVHVVVDVESDGPAPALYSMVSLGAVVCAPPFRTAFGLKTRPISQDYVAEALAISDITRAVHETYPDPADVVPDFARWLKSLGGRPVMWSDNPAFDWQWVTGYGFTQTFQFHDERIRSSRLRTSQGGHWNNRPTRRGVDEHDRSFFAGPYGSLDAVINFAGLVIAAQGRLKESTTQLATLTSPGLRSRRPWRQARGQRRRQANSC